MRTSRLGEALKAHLVVVAAGLALCSTAFGDPTLPTPNPDFGTLRPGYLQTWYIYNDKNDDGILDPGDQLISPLINWWTPVSATTQSNYTPGPYGSGGPVGPGTTFNYANGQDWSSAPMNFASLTDPSQNFWLPREPNTIQFYMTYSQFDNQNFRSLYAGVTDPNQVLIRDRNQDRNGWALGWVTNSILKDANGVIINNQNQAGHDEFSIYVHNGRNVDPNGDVVPGWNHRSFSNPQVSMSNDISPLAGQGMTQYHPPTYSDATKSYDPNSQANTAYRQVDQNLSLTDFNTVVNSMEVREYDPNGLPSKPWMLRTPSQISSPTGPKSDDGSTYLYQDAFMNDGNHVVGASDGGVIAGLAGQSLQDPNKWGQQQVIRIDMAPNTLASGDPNIYGNISKVVFWDFGYEPNSGQLMPYSITLDLSDANLFPEGRFYIAETEIAPEPITMTLMALGAAGMVLMRRKNKKV